MLGENFAKYRNFKILSAFMCTKVLGENFAKYRNFKILSAFMCTKVLFSKVSKGGKVKQKPRTYDLRHRVPRSPIYVSMTDDR